MFLILLSLIRVAIAYEPVKGINLPVVTEEEEYHFFEDIKLKFQIYQPENYKYDGILLNRAILAGTASSLLQIKKMNLLYNRCYFDEKLEIYEISEKELNNPNRFPKEYIGNSSGTKPSLWGYHDPRNNEPGYDAIVISPHSKEINYRIMVHEIAHYWYAAFCLQDRINISSEEFAIMIQEKEKYWE